MAIRLRAALLLFLFPALQGGIRAQCREWVGGFGPSEMGMDESSSALAVFDDGNGPALYAGGRFSLAGGVPTQFIARWNGTSWSPLGSGTNGSIRPITALAVWDDGSGDALYAGGDFTIAGGISANRIARWDGSSWASLGSGMNSRVFALAVFDDGNGAALYAGGDFTQAGGVTATRIAKWDGSSWSTLGSGLEGSGAAVYSLTVFDDGGGPALFAGGYFGSAGGQAASNIAKWDGSTWLPLGSGMAGSSQVFALTVFDDGGGPALYAGGNFSFAGGNLASFIAKWDGAAWSALGSGITGSYVDALATFDDGTGTALYAGGDFTQAGGNLAHSIARWDGTSWTDVDGGLYENSHSTPFVAAMAVFDDLSGDGPDLYAGGEFERAGASIPSSYIARFVGCSNPGLPLCFGDGSGAPCPCSNTGSPRHGCENSAGTGGAVLVASGSTVPDTIVLQSSGELPTALSIFLQGTIVITPTIFGDGLRCTGGSLKRLYVKSASGGAASAPGPGDPSITARSAALGAPIPPGHRRYYQVYYRDAAPAFCPAPPGATFNASNALKLVW